jgi:enoyl-CoA hydratase/carnithine racemase
METKSEVGLEVIGPEHNVALITIHRPAKRNALRNCMIVSQIFPRTFALQ